jgi:hypothetical protein
MQCVVKLHRTDPSRNLRLPLLRFHGRIELRHLEDTLFVLRSMTFEPDEVLVGLPFVGRCFVDQIKYWHCCYKLVSPSGVLDISIFLYLAIQKCHGLAELLKFRVVDELAWCSVGNWSAAMNEKQIMRVTSKGGGTSDVP